MEIAIRNRSNGVTDLTVAKWASAVNRQVQRDFIPVWGGAVKDVWIEFDQNPESADWIIDVLDTSDLAGAAGYHTFDDDGTPYGTVFLNTGLDPSVILSHEVLEAIGDPAVNRWAINWNDGYWYTIEVCDAVQNTRYWIDDVAVSDFVYPSWFGMEKSVQTAFTWRNRRMDPFSLADGGYIIRMGNDGQEQVLGTIINPNHARLDFRLKGYRS